MEQYHHYLLLLPLSLPFWLLSLSVSDLLILLATLLYAGVPLQHLIKNYALWLCNLFGASARACY
jgi:hypothetical protein